MTCNGKRKEVSGRCTASLPVELTDKNMKRTTGGGEGRMVLSRSWTSFPVNHGCGLDNAHSV